MPHPSLPASAPGDFAVLRQQPANSLLVKAADRLGRFMPASRHESGLVHLAQLKIEGNEQKLYVGDLSQTMGSSQLR